jgi:hypothetical protein
LAGSGIKRRIKEKQQRQNVGIMFLFWWQVWKERNRQVFENNESSFLQVAELVKLAARELGWVFPAG